MPRGIFYTTQASRTLVNWLSLTPAPPSYALQPIRSMGRGPKLEWSVRQAPHFWIFFFLVSLPVSGIRKFPTNPDLGYCQMVSQGSLPKSSAASTGTQKHFWIFEIGKISDLNIELGDSYIVHKLFLLFNFLPYNYLNFLFGYFIFIHVDIMKREK